MKTEQKQAPTLAEALQLIEQRNAELTVINSVQEGMAADMDMQKIYDLVGDRIRDLFDAQVAAICTFNFENNTEEFQYIYEDGERLNMDPRPIDKVRQKLIDTRELLCFNENVDAEWSKITGEEPTVVPGTQLTQSAIFVPMKVGGNVFGYVSLQNVDRENAFSESDIQLLTTLTNSMSVALVNARLFHESEQRNAELAVINSVQQGLVAEMDMQGIYDLVGDKIKDLFDSQVTVIAGFDHESHTEVFNYVFEDGKRYYPDSREYNQIREKIIDNHKSIYIRENAVAEVKKLGIDLKAAPGTKAPKSMVYVPLIVGEDVRGYVSLQNLDQEHAFSDSDVRLLTTLANSMSVAIENARLYNETEQRNAELAVINGVQQGLVAEMDMQGIYDLVGDRVRDLFDAQVTGIDTFDHENEYFNYLYEDGERLYPEPRPLNKARKWFIKRKKLWLVNENLMEEVHRNTGIEVKAVPGTRLPKSMILVPLIANGEVVGCVSLQNLDREYAFSQSDVRLLSTLANSMTVALENARLFNETTRLLTETEQRAAEMQTVNNISKALVSQLKFDALMQLVGEQMRETFDADIVYLALHDTKTDMLNFPYYYGDVVRSRPFGNGITEKIILNKEPLLINKDLNKAYDKLQAEKKGKMVESYLGVPIIANKKSVGVISVQSTEQKNRFSENDLRLLSTIAANVGIAMQNAEAYQKLQEALTDLKATQNQLVQSEKMASLGELTAGIAHEIKNPLNFVNNFSDVSKELLDEMKAALKEGNTEEAKAIADDVIQNLEKINHHGKRADSIVKGMLQHSHSNSGEKQLTDINVLTDEYFRLAYHGLRAKNKSFNATMKTEFDESLEKINVVPQDLGRVILNLITNAFYATTKRQKLEKNGFEPTVTVATKRSKSGDNIELTVSDNGNGIPKKIVDKIFQPFFTTKPTGQGTGLGLSLSYDIVKAHGGEIRVNTKEGSGTEFCVQLPTNHEKR